MSTPTTSRTCGASANASAPEPVPESSARSSPFGATNRTTSSSSAAARASCSSATRSAVLANRSRVASCILERLLLRGDRTHRPFLRDLREQPPDLGAGWKPQLVPAQERLGRLVAPRFLDGGRQLAGAEIRERVQRPRLGRASEAVDRARVRLRAFCAEQRGRVAPELVRDR